MFASYQTKKALVSILIIFLHHFLQNILAISNYDYNANVHRGNYSESTGWLCTKSSRLSHYLLSLNKFISPTYYCYLLNYQHVCMTIFIIIIVIMLICSNLYQHTCSRLFLYIFPPFFESFSSLFLRAATPRWNLLSFHSLSAFSSFPTRITLKFYLFLSLLRACTCDTIEWASLSDFESSVARTNVSINSHGWIMNKTTSKLPQQLIKLGYFCLSQEQTILHFWRDL
jgi:hypothetical protein